MFELPKNLLEIRNLDHCWICESKTSLHEHHIIPQCFGGTKGPLVTLCATCHNAIHAISEDRDVDYIYDNSEKAIYLVQVIKKAQDTVSLSQNKRAKVVLDLSAEEVIQLERVQDYFGGAGREKAIKSLILNFVTKL